MLRRANRLSARQVEAAVKSGKAFHSANLTLRFIVSGSGPVKIAAIAPVKAVKKPVLRSRARRLIYEAARPLLSKIRNGVQATVMTKSTVTDMNLNDITTEMAGLFEKAGLLR